MFRTGLIESLVQDKFLLAKKLAFETDDNTKHQNSMWSSSAKVGNSVIKVLIADISDDNKEFAVLIQMDNFAPHALKISDDEGDFGMISINIGEDQWVDAGTIVQAKLLSGIESLAEIVVEWKRNDEYSNLYKKMVMFLNFQEDNNQ